MPKYTYKARDINAKRFTGGFEARDAEEATLRLSAQNLFLIDLKEKEEKSSGLRLKSKQLSEFSKELSLMLHAGLPMVKALNIIAVGDVSGDKRVKELYLKMHRSLKNGMSLSEAMRKEGRAFPELMINMIYSGEVSGTIADVADKMSDYYTADYKLKKKISQAANYPKILGGMTIVVIIIVFAFVLPSILDSLGDMELPGITRFMKGISDFIIYKWYYLLIYIFIFAMVSFYMLHSYKVRFIWDSFKLRIPKVGNLLRIIYTARFARTLSSLYSSGIQLINAIGVSSKIIGNRYVEKQFDGIVRRIKQGEAMSAVLADTDGFSGKLQSVLVIGEETGKLDDILTFAASSFEFDADLAISSLLAMLEPALLIVMAIVIGSVIIAVLLPILQMYQAAGGGF